MNFAQLLVQKFRRYPFWSQLLITLGSLVVLIAIWTACGLPPTSPAPSPPPPLSSPIPLPIPRTDLRGNNGPVLALAFGSTGTWLAAGTEDGNVRMWELSTGKVSHSLRGHHGSVACVAVSPDGGLLATGSSDKTVKIWDASRAKELRILTGHTARITGIVFSPDGRWLVSTSEDKTIRLWNSSTGEELRTLEGHSGTVNAVAFSPDGQLLASAGDDKTLRLWDPATGKLVRTLSGHNSRVLSVAFSPDGKLLASGGSAQDELSAPNRTAQLRLWNPLTGKEEYSFHSVIGDVRSLAFSPNNKVLANSNGSSELTEIISWDVQTRTVLSRWNAHRANINTLAYSPDGQWLASGGDDGRIRLWQ